MQASSLNMVVTEEVEESKRQKRRRKRRTNRVADYVNFIFCAGLLDFCSCTRQTSKVSLVRRIHR
jgi:hypothetical protein